MRHTVFWSFRKRRIAKTLVLFLAASGLCETFPIVKGQECYPPEVTEGVRSTVKGIAQIPLTVTELPKLKEKLIYLVQENHGENSELPAVRLYEVTPATNEVVNGKIVSVTVQLDDDSVWVVGVGQNKTVYRLAGFSDSVLGFNRLMSDLAIHVKRSDDALKIFHLFLSLGHSPQFFSSVVGDTMQLQSIVLQDFRLRFPEAKRLAAYDRWWNAMPPRLRKTIASPNARSLGSNFEVSYYRYSQGVLKKESVFISSDGSVTPEATSRLLYRN